MEKINPTWRYRIYLKLEESTNKTTSKHVTCPNCHSINVRYNEELNLYFCRVCDTVFIP